MTHVKDAQADGLHKHKLLKGWCGSAPGLIRAQRAYFTSAITRRCSFLRARIILRSYRIAIATRLFDQVPLHPLHCATADAELCCDRQHANAGRQALPDSRFRGT